VEKHRHSLFLRPRAVKHILTFIAFASLFFDVAISLVTLASVQIGIATVEQILIYLNYALTVVVIITAAFFADYLFAVHYHKITAMFRHKH
jgi:hypothetical protein